MANKPIHFGLCSYYFPPEITSAAKIFYDLGRQLSDLGHKVTVFTGFPRYNVPQLPLEYKGKLWIKQDDNGMEIIRLLNLDLSRDSLVKRGISQVVSTGLMGIAPPFLAKPDIFIIYSPPIFLPAFIIMAQKIAKKPAIVNIQDLQPQSIIDLGFLKNPLLIQAFRMVEKFVYKNAAAVTVHSPGNKAYVEEHGADAQKVFVIENFVDCEKLSPGQRENSFRKQYGFENKFLVSFGGVMGHSQDMEVILNAAERLKKYQDIEIALVGFGPKKEKTQQQAQKRSLTNIHFIPPMSPEEYTSVLHATDVGLATLEAEVKSPVVPSKILSYMATGTPTILTADLSGDAAKVIKEANAGYALPPGDDEAMAEAISNYYQNQGLFKEHMKNARQYAIDHFSLQSCAKQYINLAKDILAA